MQALDIINSSNAVTGYVYKKQNDVVYYFQLRRLNDSLLKENARLKNQLAEGSEIDTFKEVVATIPVTIKDTTTPPVVKDSTGAIKIAPTGKAKVIKYASYTYIPARVINNSISNDRQNYITINRGSADGVQKKMAVVTTNGIVGQIENVSEHYATIVSTLSARKVSAKLSDGTITVTSWESGTPDFVVAEKMPLYTTVKKGDSVFTGNSFYPENILVGRVAKIDTNKAGSKDLKIRLSTNFRNLQYVYVVKNPMDTERRKLEEETEKAEKATDKH